MSAKSATHLDANKYRHRAALMRANEIDRLPKRQRVETIAELILTNETADLFRDRVKQLAVVNLGARN